MHCHIKVCNLDPDQAWLTVVNPMKNKSTFHLPFLNLKSKYIKKSPLSSVYCTRMMVSVKEIVGNGDIDNK